jgi:hypothetical protein
MDGKNPASGQEPRLQNQERAAPIHSNEAWKASARTRKGGKALDTRMDKYGAGGEGQFKLLCVEAREGNGKGEADGHRLQGA